MSICNRTATRPLVEHDCVTWPPAERLRWMRVFDPERARHPWRRPSQYEVAGVYTRYLACCRRNDLPPAIAPDGVRAFIRACEAEGNTVRTIDGYVAKLSRMARLLYPRERARYAWLRETSNGLHAVAKATPKLKSDRIVTSDALIMRAQELIAEARAAVRQNSWKTTELMRNGLFLWLGAEDPERLQALGSLRRSWIDLDARLIRFPPDVIKTKTESVRVISDEVAELFVEWWNVHRARYQPSHEAVWIAKGGKPAALETLAAAVKRVTKEPFTIPITPQRFRDAAATFMVEQSPEKASRGSTVLRHQSQDMTQEYTEQAKGIIASRKGAAMIAAGRERVRKSVRAITRSTIALAPKRRR